MFRVFQIELTDEQRDEVNAKGWDGVTWGEAYLEATSFLRDNDANKAVFYAAEAKLYRHTMNIDCEEVNELFPLGNGMGDMSKVRELCEHKSLSVGDVVEDLRDGSFWVCCAFGWSELTDRPQAEVRRSVERNRVAA